MKILHVINTLNTGGAERLLVDVSASMVENGYDVEVLVLNPKRTTLWKELENKNVRIQTIRGLYNEYNPCHIFKLIPIIKKYDIVHVHLFPSQYWVALASLFLLRKTVLVTTEHSTGNSRARHKITSGIDRWIYTHYDGIFCISKGTEEFMSTRVTDRSRLFVVTNGIDVARFASVKASRHALLPEVPKEACLLMQVARFGEQKNQACVIRAMKLLPPGFHLVFVGSGIREEECRALAHQLDLDQHITFLGDRSDVPQLLSVADLVIMSSHWEGFGLSAAEAMASGKIVLASDVPGLSQVVADPDLRFEENNEQQLKDLILKYSDPTARSIKEVWAKEWVQQYDVRHTSLQYIQMYEHILNKKNGKEKENPLL